MQATLRMPRSAARIRRTPFDFALLFTLVILCAVVGSVVWWQVWHVNRIYAGVTIGGVPVGGLTRAAALERIDDSLLRYPLPSITVTHAGRQWPITADDARVSTDLLASVNRAYLVGRQADWPARLNAQLVAVLGGVDIAPDVVLDVGQLRYTVSVIANEVRTPARPETKVGDVTLPAQPGYDVDVEKTVQTLMAAIEAAEPGESVVTPLAVVEQAAPPADAADPIADPTATPALDGAAATGAAGRTLPLLLRDAQFGLEFALDPVTINRLRAGGTLDETALRAILQGWAAQVDVAPRDARLRFDHATQSPVVVQTSRAGRRLDVDATLATIRGALMGNQPSADLIITPLAPAVDSNRVAEMGIRELVASGVSYFAGSSRERVLNIQVASEKFDNVVIPPNGIFSFNQLIEDISAANGFEDSLIIWGDRTAVGIGGGVCQVSTTVFRAAFEGGFPLVERYNHGYIVDWYGEPGLDATIFTPTVDFKFRNDTGAHLLIEPVVDAANGVLTFNFYGTKPDRTVVIGEPVQTNVVPPPPPLYTVDPSLAPGQIKQVEWAKPGMTVAVTRTITQNGQTRTETLTSQYQPWRAIYLVGSEADIPASARANSAPAGESVSIEADTSSTAPAQPAATPDTPPATEDSTGQ